MNALGLIETMGIIGAIEACDVACKTSDVKIYNRHLIKGGIVTVEFIGDISSINVAIEAAIEATKKLGVFLNSHIIARPNIEILEILEEDLKEVDSKKIEIKEEIKEIEVIEISEEKKEKYEVENKIIKVIKTKKKKKKE